MGWGMIYDGMNEKGEFVNQTPEENKTVALVREMREQAKKGNSKRTCGRNSLSVP